MAGNLLKKDALTAEYRFARDLVRAVIEMKKSSSSNVSLIQKPSIFFTDAMRLKVKGLFKPEWPELEDFVRKFTSGDGKSEDYSDGKFDSCVQQLIGEYKPENKSEEEFLFLCDKVSYVAAYFLRKNDQSNAVSIATKHVKEMCPDTFCASTIVYAPIFHDIYDSKYLSVCELVRALVAMRGISLPELPEVNTQLFTNSYRDIIEKLLFDERSAFEEIVKDVAWKDGTCDFSDETFSILIDEIVKIYISEQSTESEVLRVSAQIAYSATCFLIGNSKSNAENMAVDGIHKIVKKSFYFNKYEQDDNYRFSCELLEAVVKMESNLFEMSYTDKSLFIVTHRNKIEDFLSQEKPGLDEAVEIFSSKEGNFDDLFVLCMNQITDNTDTKYRSKQEMVYVCTKIAYVAVCFFNKNINSKALVSAMNRMLEIVKDISLLPSSDDEKELIIHTHDDYYRFAYDLVKTVLEMQGIPVSDANLPDPNEFLFTETHRNQIKDILKKESAELDKLVKCVTDKFSISDFSNSNFLSCMHYIITNYRLDQKTEEGILHVGVIIAYLSLCFIKKNCKSDAAFLAVNRIHEMFKYLSCFVNSMAENLCIVKIHDANYRFAYDLSKVVLSFKGLPTSPVDIQEQTNSDELFFTGTCQKEVEAFLSNERAELDEMVTKLTDGFGRLDYTDDKFLNCMDQIVQDYQHEQNGRFVRICTRIAYTAGEFYIKNFNSQATFLAVNRLYEMSQDAFRDKMEDVWNQEENFRFTYDLVIAALKMGNNLSSKMVVSDIGDSLLTSVRRNEMRDFLSKEWPRLNRLVRIMTRTFGGKEFSHRCFDNCMRKIVSDYEAYQKSEEGLLLTGARIAYVATHFLRKNQDLTVAYSALDIVYQMVKNFHQTNPTEETKPAKESARDDMYRFAVDLVRTVMELQGTPAEDLILPYAGKCLFTGQHRKKIKNLFLQQMVRSELAELVESSKGNYSDDSFVQCMDKIFKKYKKEQGTKDGFVGLCARMAYPVSFFKRENDESNAEELAVNRIHEMVRNTYYFNKELEGKSLMQDLKDDKYRFAHDLVSAVVNIRGQKLPNEEFPFYPPSPKKFLFTAKHRRKMEESFSKKNIELHDIIRKYTRRNRNPNCREENFNECIDKIIKKFKPDVYTEERFVLLCGKIAYAASCFMDTEDWQFLNLAVNKIHDMIQDVYKRGTLSNSSW